MLEQQLEKLNKNITSLIKVMTVHHASVSAANDSDRPEKEPEEKVMESSSVSKKGNQEDVVTALTELSKAKSQQVARELLQKYDAKKIGDLDKSLFTEVIREAKSLAGAQ